MTIVHKEPVRPPRYYMNVAERDGQYVVERCCALFGTTEHSVHTCLEDAIASAKSAAEESSALIESISGALIRSGANAKLSGYGPEQILELAERIQQC